jgi:hypothetical protein
MSTMTPVWEAPGHPAYVSPPILSRLRLKSVVVLRYVLECLELLPVVAAEDLTPLLGD